MTTIEIAGAGAFGTALGIALHRGGRNVSLVGRSVPKWRHDRKNPRLPDITVPEGIRLSGDLLCDESSILLLAVPMQSLSDFLAQHAPKPAAAIACSKGIDLSTGLGPTALIQRHLSCPSGILTGPSFAADIARGLPTALTFATKMDGASEVQAALSTDLLRIYLSDDPIGAELGGSLKNVIAIACGICIGAGLGDSARAALMTRGFSEIHRLALALGGRPETLMGLSGFGDLALTCTSTLSRNFSFGLRLGQDAEADTGQTIEGIATASAVVDLAAKHKIEMPIATTVKAMIEKSVTLEEALESLLSRPLRKE